MRASQVLQKCLSSSLGEMHALRSRVLLRSVEALLEGRRLTLMDSSSQKGTEAEVSPRNITQDQQVAG
jgi:hypothetical protein